MKKPIATGLLTICLCALPLAGVASAQQTGNDMQNQAGQSARDVGNAARDASNKQGGSSGGFGLFGLIGLAGLVGLFARRPTHEHEVTPREGFRRQEPLGSP